MGKRASAAIAIAVALAVSNLLGATAQPGDRLQGSYGVTLTVPELVAAGAARTIALGDAGDWNLTVAATAWSLRQTNGAFGNALDRGTLARHGARLMLTLVSSNAKAHHEYLGAVLLRESGAVLRFAEIQPVFTELVRVLAAGPWRRHS